MISAQYGQEFTKSEYGKIKKVYSIWVCVNPSEEYKNTITQYSIRERQLAGHASADVRDYDLLSVVMICLGTEGDGNSDGLLRFLEVLLSEQRSAAEKKEILESEIEAKGRWKGRSGCRTAAFCGK